MVLVCDDSDLAYYCYEISDDSHIVACSSDS